MPGGALRRSDAKDLLKRAHELRGLVDELDRAGTALRRDVSTAFEELREQMVRRELGGIPVSRLRDVADGRLRTGPIEQAGYRTVLAVHDVAPDVLRLVPGIGSSSARHLVAAARQVATAVRDGLRIRVDLDPADPVSSALVVALHRLREVERAAEPVSQHHGRIAEELDGTLPAAAETGSVLRRIFTGRARRDAAQEAAARVARVVADADGSGHTDVLRAAVTRARERAEPTAAWNAFQRRSPEFYGLLGEIVELGGDAEATAGFLPAEMVAAIAAHPLDDAARTVSLRGYQAFGARFALSRRRVILGDEMGLGKTIQAIAVMAHLHAAGNRRFLVVCPASVLVNWTREVAERSTLSAHRLHGADRDRARTLWERDGGVAVTTLDSLHLLDVRQGVEIDLLVVDEAHYVKNPGARRSKAVRRWTARVPRTVFLTGTPMENRVEEFRTLVEYLQPELLPQIEDRHGIAGPAAFRRAVAPVYLRRNQDDVLAELPELVCMDDWLEFTSDDRTAYIDAVASGNFMAMRRAAFVAANSAKRERLAEITEEAAANGRKVVVFSFFRDVLATAHAALVGPLFGPLDGRVGAAARQDLVDRFEAIDGPAILLAQIQAGGTGLNMQRAANIVVLCEPQVKPSWESQAIARLHRMGQVRSVQAHRLLVADSVDQRMVEMLARKSRLFDEYARRSDVAEHSPDAVDISEVELARRVVAEEQERLAAEIIERQRARSPGHA